MIAGNNSWIKLDNEMKKKKKHFVEPNTDCTSIIEFIQHVYYKH